MFWSNWILNCIFDFGIRLGEAFKVQGCACHQAGRQAGPTMIGDFGLPRLLLLVLSVHLLAEVKITEIAQKSHQISNTSKKLPAQKGFQTSEHSAGGGQACTSWPTHSFKLKLEVALYLSTLRTCPLFVVFFATDKFQTDMYLFSRYAFEAMHYRSAWFPTESSRRTRLCAKTHVLFFHVARLGSICSCRRGYLIPVPKSPVPCDLVRIKEWNHQAVALPSLSAPSNTSLRPQWLPVAPTKRTPSCR
jgi:hypothetical protein